eukprot:4763411-Amphidinium_carterae.3
MGKPFEIDAAARVQLLAKIAWCQNTILQESACVGDCLPSTRSGHIFPGLKMIRNGATNNQ